MMYDVFGFVILNIIYTVPYIKSKMLLQIGFVKIYVLLSVFEDFLISEPILFLPAPRIVECRM